MKHAPPIWPRSCTLLVLAALVVCAAPQTGRTAQRDTAPLAAFEMGRLATLETSRLAALEADPIEAGHEALSQGRRPWYDADADATQTVELDEPFDMPQFDLIGGTWAQSFAWATLAVLVVLLISGVVYALVHWQRPIDNAEPELAHVTELAAARSELLPVRAGSTADQLRAEAQQHFDAGRYGEAVVCLYSIGLLTLDQLQAIHLARGKTNRQYLRELSRRGTLEAPMRQMVDTFEGYFFGGHEVSRQRCEQCQAHVDTIHAARQELTG